MSVYGVIIWERILKQELMSMKVSQNQSRERHTGFKWTPEQGKSTSPCCSQDEGQPGKGG